MTYAPSPRASTPLALAAFAVVLVLTSAAQAADPNACQWVGPGAGAPPNAFADALARGPLYAFLITWLFGLGVALTPCVYPMIAVTVSIFGARQAESRWQGAALSGVFVLGIVALFVPLGVLAAKTGALMGAWLQNPWVFVGIAALFLAMAASMFGAFELALPSSVQTWLSDVGGAGYRGAFLLGLVSALVATPCTGPFLTGLIAWIAESQHTGLGVIMMTAFALGLGTPFFLVGAFAMQLPKSGKWMVHVKTGLGAVLVVAALYYLGNAFPAVLEPIPGGLGFAGLALGVAALGIGLLVVAARRKDGWATGAKVPGVILLTLGTYLALTSALKPPPGTSLEWAALSMDQARARAVAEQRPLLVDFTASWCVACKELDRYTFSSPTVAAEARRFIAVKVDLTDDDDPQAVRFKDELKIRGLPTVLLFDSVGTEVVRCTDFVPPTKFVEAARRVH